MDSCIIRKNDDDDNSFLPSSTPARWRTNSRETTSLSLSPRFTYLELVCHSVYALDMYTRGTDGWKEVQYFIGK